jgi:hypothetical protein
MPLKLLTEFGANIQRARADPAGAMISGRVLLATVRAPRPPPCYREAWLLEREEHRTGTQTPAVLQEAWLLEREEHRTGTQTPAVLLGERGKSTVQSQLGQRYRAGCCWQPQIRSVVRGACVGVRASIYMYVSEREREREKST